MPRARPPRDGRSGLRDRRRADRHPQARPRARLRHGARADRSRVRHAMAQAPRRAHRGAARAREAMGLRPEADRRRPPHHGRLPLGERARARPHSSAFRGRRRIVQTARRDGRSQELQPHRESGALQPRHRRLRPVRVRLFGDAAPRAATQGRARGPGARHRRAARGLRRPRPRRLSLRRFPVLDRRELLRARRARALHGRRGRGRAPQRDGNHLRHRTSDRSGPRKLPRLGEEALRLRDLQPARGAHARWHPPRLQRVPSPDRSGYQIRGQLLPDLSQIRDAQAGPDLLPAVRRIPQAQAQARFRGSLPERLVPPLPENVRLIRVREDRPSSTATLIAAATVFLARDARVPDLVPPGAAEWCARCLEALSGLKTVEMLSHPGLRWAARLAERATVPGLLLHFMLRKRWIEEVVRSALAEGCEQVVVMGAGFDTLALRLLQRAGGRVVFTVMEPASDGRSAFHNATPLVRHLLSRWSEPFKSALPRDDAARFLARFGFRLRALAAAETLRETYLAPSGRESLTLARGEMIVLADCYD